LLCVPVGVGCVAGEVAVVVGGLVGPPGGAGILFAENSAEELARAFLITPELQAKMSVTAKLRAADFSWENIARRHVQLYQNPKQ